MRLYVFSVHPGGEHVVAAENAALAAAALLDELKGLMCSYTLDHVADGSVSVGPVTVLVAKVRR